jgi:hypothetical protein
MLTIAERKQAMMQQMEFLKSIGPNTANHKFLISFRTRLSEEGIQPDHALLISVTIKVIFADINEEDDFINDYAIKLAEVVKDHYDMLHKHRFIGAGLELDVIKQYFAGWSFTL